MKINLLILFCLVGLMARGQDISFFNFSDTINRYYDSVTTKYSCATLNLLLNPDGTYKCTVTQFKDTTTWYTQTDSGKWVSYSEILLLSGNHNFYNSPDSLFINTSKRTGKEMKKAEKKANEKGFKKYRYFKICTTANGYSIPIEIKEDMYILSFNVKYK